MARETPLGYVMLTVELLLVCLPVLVWAVCGTLWLWRYRPRRERPWPRHMLVLAAHPDDCVIIAGESAIEAVRAGRRVTIAVLTCGDYEPGTAYAQRRMEESVQAWSLAGVPAQNIIPLDLVQSPLDGPPAQTQAELARAGTTLRALMAGLPAGAAIYVPAAQESHVDHRTLRAVAFGALRASGRRDLVVLEGPLYNSCVSFVRQPARALVQLAACLPGAYRLWPSLGGRPAAATFAQGCGGRTLVPDPTRLDLKRRMLACFATQGGPRLAEIFGFPDVYRTVTAGDLVQSEPRCRHASGCTGWSVWIFWVAVSVSLVADTFAVVHLLRLSIETELVVAGMSLGLAAPLVLYALIWRTQLHRRVMMGISGLGLTAGGVLHLV